MTRQENDTTTTLHIRNMVCDRCILVVDGVLRHLGLEVLSVGLGEALISGRPDQAVMEEVRAALEALGFALIDDPRQRLAEQIRNQIVALVHERDRALRVNLSERLREATGHGYGYLSRLFSETTGTTIERYYIAQRIERAKELLTYGELTLSQIADRLHYSSTAHLSAQFKSVTGMTPSRFRKLAGAGRKPLDKL